MLPFRYTSMIPLNGLEASVTTVFPFAAIAFIVFSYWRFRRAVKMVSNFPGLRLPVSPMSTLGLLLPSLPNPLRTYPGFAFPSRLKHAGFYKLFKCDTVSLCAWDGRAMLYTCDVPFLTRICSYASRQVFPKPIEEYTVLSYFGDNLVIAEHENWRRQRRVTAPAFSSKMFARLWVDMRNIVEEMVHQDKWVDRTEGYQPNTYAPSSASPDDEYVPAPGEIYFPHVVDITLRMALAAIARTGFGIEFSWRSDESFTQVCTRFGEPQRWKWWLSFLDRIYAEYDSSPIPRYTKAVNGWVQASVFMQSLMEDLASLWSITLLLPVRIFWTITRWFMAEIFAMIRRPTSSDWKPKTMKIQEALHLVSKDSTLRLAMPSWMLKLPIRRIRRMRIAFNTLEAGLNALVSERKEFHAARSSHTGGVELDRLDHSATSSSLSVSTSGTSHASSTYSNELDYEEAEERSDLLHNLVKTALLDTRAGQEGLTDSEIVGNTYIYLIAGHETTSYSLAWTLALLAAYPEFQEMAFQEIMENDPAGDTTVIDYPKFRFILACYYETLRLFPPVQQIPKVVAEDLHVVVEKSNEMDDEPEETGEQPVVTIQAATPKLDATEAELAFTKSNHRRLTLDFSSMTAGLPSTTTSGTPETPPKTPITTRDGGIAISLPCTPNAFPVSPSPIVSPSGSLLSVPGTPLRSSAPSLVAATALSTPEPGPKTLGKFDGPMPYTKISGGKQMVVQPEQRSFVVEKGTIVMVAPPAVHYNPKYWEDPEAFDPRRFLKPYCHSAFIPFGVGHRACLGRKFSEVESVSMLVHLLRDYSVHLVPNGESVEEARRKFSKSCVRITLTPEKVPLIFRRRVVA